MRRIHVSGSWCCHLLASKRSRLQQHEFQMAALASTKLDMCLTPQQTAEMNPFHWDHMKTLGVLFLWGYGSLDSAEKWLSDRPKCGRTIWYDSLPNSFLHFGLSLSHIWSDIKLLYPYLKRIVRPFMWPQLLGYIWCNKRARAWGKLYAKSALLFTDWHKMPYDAKDERNEIRPNHEW